MNQHSASPGMSPLVKNVSRIVKGFILLYGIHIIFYGHLTPGGGFAGGVVAASAFVLIALAEGDLRGLKTFPQRTASIGESVGMLTFIGMAVLGLVIVGTFFVNVWSTSPAARFSLLSGGIIPICNLAIGLKVCCSLYLVFVVFSAVRTSPDAQEDGGDAS